MGDGMPESFRTRLMRWGCNFFPAYRGSGAWVTYIAADWREVQIRVPLSWQTRNYVGTIFGGSMYAAVDPFYMLMLINNLGPDYLVWDKSACIRFKKPGVSTLRARFVLEQAELDAIRVALESALTVDRVYHIDLTDESGEVRAWVDKTVNIRLKGTGKEAAAKEIKPWRVVV
jgi:acyl-coenzyme A thioesterase PaaI-like protein